MTGPNVFVPQVSTWSTGKLAGAAKYDSWVDVLNRTYGSWEVPQARSSGFSATLRKTNFGDFGIAECICDPCGGARKRNQIANDDKEVLVIQLTRSGRERIRFGNREYELGPGDIMIWDSTRKMMFSVEERLDKVSIMLPLLRLQSWMPQDWHDVPRKITARSPDSILLASYIRALTSEHLGESLINGEHLAEATVALLCGSVTRRPGSDDKSLRSTQLGRVQAYIEQNLEDPELKLPQIAVANGISLRYLHWLFHSTGETAARYIQKQRLARCHRDLQNPLMKERKIADVALSWGFSDAMHFSRAFKETYGLRPSDVRKP